MFSPTGSVMPMPMVVGSVTSLFAAWNASYAESATAPASSTGITANEAIYVPFVVTEPTTWTRGFWYNGSVGANQGNVCIGIYDEAGNRLATTGAVAASGAAIQSAAFTASVFLQPGNYYMAYSPSASGINAIMGYTASLPRGRYAGCYRQAVGSHPLPSTATFATWTSLVMPVFGVARTSFAL